MTGEGVVIGGALALLVTALVVDWAVAFVLTREALVPPRMDVLTAQMFGRLSVAFAMTLTAIVAVHGTVFLWGLPAIGLPAGTRILPTPWATVILYVAAIAPSLPSAYYLWKFREWRSEAEGTPRRRRDDPR